VLSEALNSIVGVESLPDQRHIGLIADYGRNALMQQRMVVNAENANFSSIAHLAHHFFAF
jgi:hypothetical protein